MHAGNPEVLAFPHCETASVASLLLREYQGRSGIWRDRILVITYLDLASGNSQPTYSV